MNKTYVLSGYFAEILITSSLHFGHVKYISEVLAKMDESDRMIIIVNNEKQRLNKYNALEGISTDAKIKLFSPGSTIQIVERLIELYPNKGIRVMISKSDDQTVCQDLENIAWFYADRKQVVFVKDGGEYNSGNLPEFGIKGITFMFLEDPKEASASEIIKKYSKNIDETTN